MIEPGTSIVPRSPCLQSSVLPQDRLCSVSTKPCPFTTGVPVISRDSALLCRQTQTIQMGLQVPGVDPREGVVVYAGNCLPDVVGELGGSFHCCFNGWGVKLEAHRG